MLYNEDWGGTFWVWHAAKTLAVLEESIQDPEAFATTKREKAAEEKDAIEEAQVDVEDIEGDE